MRTVERRTIFSRRGLLKTGAAAGPVAALVGTAITEDAAWAQEAKALGPHVMATLVKAARDIFPHDHIGDVFYVRACTPYEAKAGKDDKVRAMLADGLVDELHLFVYPVAVGEGPKLFPEGGGERTLTLTGCESFSNGVVHLSYGPASADASGEAA